MKTSFLYSGPHPVHAEWARSIGAEFISNRIDSKISIPNVSRLIKSIIVIKQIPKGTNLLLCESGAEILAGALWKKKNPDEKLVLILGDPKLFHLNNMSFLKKKLYNWALLYFDLFIAVSKLARDFVPNHLRDRCRVVYPFIDVERFSSISGDLSLRNIIYMGYIRKEKGIDKIIKMFKDLNTRYPECKLFLLGDGYMREDIIKANIKNVICPGWVDPKEYIEKSSISINLSPFDAFSTAVIEAMCSGIVPVVSVNCGAKDVIEKVHRDLIVRNRMEAVDLIDGLWTSSKLLKKYSQKCKEEAKVFTKDASLAQFKDTIMEVYK